MFWSKRKASESFFIDIHCHILPGVDDGPESLAESLAMAKIAVKDGTRFIIATPHVKEPALAPGMIQQEVALFNAELQKAGILLQVLPGAELQSIMAAESQKNYTLNGSSYVLIEFPHTHLPSDARRVIFDSLAAGLKPVIAHPERNPSVIQHPQLLLELVRSGALVQVSGESLTGSLGPDVLSCATFLLKKGAVHFLASDGHGSSWRQPVLSCAVKAAANVIGKEAAIRLVTTNPEALLKGMPLG